MPGSNKEKKENYADIQEEQSSPLTMLVTFMGLIAAAAVICTIVWVVSHQTAKQPFGSIPQVENPDVEETLVEDGPIQEVVNNTPIDEDVEPVSGDLTMPFDAVDEMVTAKEAAILRSVPNGDGVSTVVGQLMNGDVMQRVGVNKKTGWSRLMFEGAEVYAVTYMLTTDTSYRSTVTEDKLHLLTSDGKMVIFKECDDMVRAKDVVNMRTEPSTAQGSATVSSTLNTESVAHRVAYSPDAGWSRVEYNGKTLYVVTSYVQQVSNE